MALKRLFFVLFGVMLLTGCVQQQGSGVEEANATGAAISEVVVAKNAPVQVSGNHSVGSVGQVQENESQSVAEQVAVGSQRAYPAFEDLKQRLRETGIDCNVDIHGFATEKSFAIDPSNPNVLYVGVAGKGFFKSIDKGNNWQMITNGIVAYPDINKPSKKCFWAMGRTIIDPQNSRRLLMVPSDTTSGTPYQPYSETAGIWETLDGGDSWHQLLSEEMNAGGRGGIALDPKNPQVIYFGVDSDRVSFKEAGPNMTFNKVGVLYKSTNGGETWEELPTGTHEGLQAVVVFVNPTNSNEIFLITQNHGHIYTETSTIEVPAEQVFGPMKSSDGGRTWASLVSGLPASYGILLDADIAKHNFNHVILRPFIFATEQGQYIEQKSYFSTDGGQTFTRTPVYIEVGRYDPFDSSANHLIGASPFMENGKIMASSDGGATWQPIGDIPQTASGRFYASNFVWGPVDRNTIYMNGNYGQVWRSEDGGRTWENVLNLEKLP